MAPRLVIAILDALPATTMSGEHNVHEDQQKHQRERPEHVAGWTEMRSAVHDGDFQPEAPGKPNLSRCVGNQSIVR
jgi:hypothetical protein